MPLHRSEEPRSAGFKLELKNGQSLKVAVYERGRDVYVIHVGFTSGGRKAYQNVRVVDLDGQVDPLRRLVWILANTFKGCAAIIEGGSLDRQEASSDR